MTQWRIYTQNTKPGLNFVPLTKSHSHINHFTMSTTMSCCLTRMDNCVCCSVCSHETHLIRFYWFNLTFSIFPFRPFLLWNPATLTTRHRGGMTPAEPKHSHNYRLVAQWTWRHSAKLSVKRLIQSFQKRSRLKLSAFFAQYNLVG